VLHITGTGSVCLSKK